MKTKKLQAGGVIDEDDLFADDVEDTSTGDSPSALDGELVGESEKPADTTEIVADGEPADAGGEGEEVKIPQSAAAEQVVGSGVDLTGNELFLARYGVQGGIIEYEDGQTAKFSDLDAAEQDEILSSLVDGSVPNIEEKYNLDGGEIDLLNTIRESDQSAEDFINNLVDYRVQTVMAQKESLSTDYTNLSDDAMFVKHLRDTHPDFTDEQIAADLAVAKDMSTYGDTIGVVREGYIAKQQQEETLSAGEDNFQFQQELEAQRQEIVTDVEALTDIAGARVSDDMKEYLLHDIMELNDNKDPLLMETVFSSPENMFKVNWFLNYGEDYITGLNTYWKGEVSKARKAGYDSSINTMGEAPDLIGSQSSKGVKQIPEEGPAGFGKVLTEEEMFG